MTGKHGSSLESIVQKVKRQTRRKFGVGAEEKIRIVLGGLRGEVGKRQLNGDTIREAGSDEVKELRTDREMEYVHIKDHRGSGLESVNVLSSYKYQDGLAYYEATKDTATHFFIDYLSKAMYVFEYPLKVVHRGAYQNGMAHIECMYAPEFNSHSESVKLEVR